MSSEERPKAVAKVIVDMEVPKGATHYAGQLGSEDVLWFKHITNSCGIDMGWWMWDEGKQGWYQGFSHFMREIPYVQGIPDRQP